MAEQKEPHAHVFHTRDEITAMKYQEKQNTLGFYEAVPTPTKEELQAHYRDQYYQNATGTYAPDYLPEEIEYFRNLAKVALETATHYKLDTSALDLGCGEGFFTKAFHSFGWNVACCDFSEFGIAKHNKDMLPYFMSGDLYQCLQKHISDQRKYGLVNLQNVLEHVIDPISLLNDVKPLLSRNSALRVKVPNDYSDFQLALQEKGFTQNTWFSPPEHLSYFNQVSLLETLEHCGYRLLSLQADFPIELFLANKNSNYWADRSLGKGAHFARVFCENHLINKNIRDYINYSEAAAKLGYGRTLVAYVTLA